jgi:radical SAM enzyme (TIGR01210 family)
MGPFSKSQEISSQIMADHFLDANILSAYPEEKITYQGISKEIRSLLKRFRQNTRKVDDGPSHWAILKDVVARPFPLRGIIGIPTRGCSYARTDWAGCSVCGHNASTLWDPNIKHESIMTDVQQSLIALSKQRPPVVCLYTSGSFLDETELPAETRSSILREVTALGWISSVVIESLPQFITSDRLDNLTREFPTLSFSIGIGLDSVNDFIRYFCFQRHIHLDVYSRALRECNKRGINTTAYIVHKPPFLSLEESISDTAESIIGAINLGFSFVSVEPVAIQAGTLQNFLLSHSLYEPATISSVVSSLAYREDSLMKTPDISRRLKLGGQVFTPLPESTIRGCKACLNSISQRFNFIPSDFFDGITTTAHGDWCITTTLIPGGVVDPGKVLHRARVIIDEVNSAIEII